MASRVDEKAFYAVRTMVGQEYNVALLLENRIRESKRNIRAVIVVDDMRGVVLVEAPAHFYVNEVVAGIKHVKGLVKGALSYNEIEKFISPKPVIETVRSEDIVEIVGGPFIGMRGKVVQVDKARGDVRIEISEASYPLPITISAEYVKIIARE